RGSAVTAPLPGEVESGAGAPPSPPGSVRKPPARLARGPGAPAAGQPEARRRMLVIDDDPSVCELMTRLCGKEGYDVVIAVNGEEGLKLAREKPPNLITLDVVMPGMDGWAVLKTLKADPQLSSIPVVMITIADEGGRGMAVGAADYLVKPVDRNRLAGVLEAHLEGPAA